MIKYRSKIPTPIEAEQWFPDKDIEGVFVEKSASGHMVAILETPIEGDVYLRPGDWVITDMEGNKYPCEHDIFEGLYEIEEGTPKAPLTSDHTE